MAFGKDKKPEAPASTPVKEPAPPLDSAATSKTVATLDRQPSSVAGYDINGVGTGFEDFDQNDLAIPFLVILQKGAPQVEEDNPKYVKGAKPGMIMNTVTNELYDGKTGVPFVPVHRVRAFLEWIPKDDGGGLVNVFAPDAKEVRDVLAKAGRKFGKLKINDNNDLVETFNVFGLMPLNGGRVTRLVTGFASSQIGGYKKWMTTAQSIQEEVEQDGKMVLVTPPMWSHRYRLRTQFFQKGEYTWYKWAVSFDGDNAAASKIAPTDPLSETAKDFRALVLSGAAQANFESAQQESETDGDGSSYDM